MAEATVSPKAEGGKRLIKAREFRAKLGGISYETLWRLQRYDPRFPQPGRMRGQIRVWEEGAADHYCEVLARTTGGH